MAGKPGDCVKAGQDYVVSMLWQVQVVTVYTYHGGRGSGVATKERLVRNIYTANLL